MKTSLIFLFLLAFFACNVNKNINLKKQLIEKSKSCPDDGVCTFEVLKNKTYTVKKDEYGSSYSELLGGKNIVLKFEYKRNELEGIQDSEYREIIYIEINSNTDNLNLKNLALKKVNIGFERLCFCRGQTGSYKITQGHLLLTKIKENEYNITLDFKTDKVPQIITSINETFKL